ncbi:MAG: hypothetical protein JWM28_3678 [Chitinophagaceae bacterium]|nr:hypothetical protein [Chitinophagaceae bacterium]
MHLNEIPAINIESCEHIFNYPAYAKDGWRFVFAQLAPRFQICSFPSC